MKKLILILLGLMLVLLSPSLSAFDYEFEFQYTEHDTYLELEIYNHHYNDIEEMRLYRSGLFVEELDPTLDYWNIHLTGFVHNTIYEFFIRYKLVGDNTLYNSVFYTFESTKDINDPTHLVKEQIDFENLHKSSYAASNLTINDREWIFSNALVGQLESDLKHGLKSARMQAVGYFQNLSSMTHISKLEFYYGNFSTNTNGVIGVYISYDNVEWHLIDSLHATANFQKYEYELDVSLYYYDLFFKIELTSGGRVNIDDIIFYSLSSPPGEPEPEDPIDPNPDYLTDINGDVIVDGIYDYQIYQANIFWLRNDTHEYLVHVSEFPDVMNDPRIRKINYLVVEDNNFVISNLDIEFTISDHELLLIDGEYKLSFLTSYTNPDVEIQSFKVRFTNYKGYEWNPLQAAWTTRQVIPILNEKYIVYLQEEYIRGYELSSVRFEYKGIEYEVMLNDVPFIDEPPVIQGKTNIFSKILTAVIIGPFYTLMSLINGETTLETIINNPITDKILFVVFFVFICIIAIKILSLLLRLTPKR